MATSLRAPMQIVTLPSSIAASTPEGSIVVLDTTDDQVKLPGGADPTTPILGLLYRSTNNANSPVAVVISGIFPGVAGASITRGAELTSNGTDGTVKAAAPAAGTNDAIIGIALESASTGERVAMLINQYVKQG